MCNQVSVDDLQVAVVKRLRARRMEIARAIYDRVHDAVPDSADHWNPEYQACVRDAVTSVVSYSLEAIERGPEWRGPIPAAASDQARRAARGGVSFGSILRRYVAGHGRLGEFVAEEAERLDIAYHASALQRVRGTLEALLEHLAAALEREYDLERGRAAGEFHRRRFELMHSLLAGEPVAPTAIAELDYEVHASWHLGVVATGGAAEDALRRLRVGLGCQLLAVPHGQGITSAWLGGGRRLEAANVERLLAAAKPADVSLAVGEPGRGIGGWRLTHHQAQAALSVAARSPQTVTAYSDCSLLAAAIQSDTLTAFLREKYLGPLGKRPDGGTTLRQTLRAYLDAECHASSAASALRAGRHTVENRVRMAERLLGRPLRTCLAELDLALRLEDLNAAARQTDQCAIASSGSLGH